MERAGRGHVTLSAPLCDASPFLVGSILHVGSFMPSDVMCSPDTEVRAALLPAGPLNALCLAHSSSVKYLISCSIHWVFINSNNLDVAVTFLAAETILILKLRVS